MRLLVACASVTLCLAACAQSAEPPPASPPPPADTGTFDPRRIERVRAEVPRGYEFAELPAPADPITFWGFEPGWTADPPQCGVLGDPGADAVTFGGWSASGAGGIIYAAVYTTAAGRPSHSVTEHDCRRWTIESGHTSGTVTQVVPPAIERAHTVGMATASATVVEGGTETVSHADTFSAYLDGYIVVIAVVTDPGSPNPTLEADFASTLLVRTVSELRR